MDLGTVFSTLINEMFPQYRGCTIENLGKQFKVFGEYYPTMEEAKKAVDKRFQVFNNIIKKNELT